MSAIELELTGDLEWREAELAAMKSLLVRTEKGTRGRKAMLRSCTAILYAHYEGFCKFCWDSYLDAVERDGAITSSQLKPELSLLSLRKLFKETRANLSDEALLSLAQGALPTKLAEPPRFDLRPETESNLWPNLLKNNLDSLGLQSDELSNFSTSLGSLVGKRNGIAHGESLTIKDLDEFVGYEKAALLVMHDIALNMIDAINSRSYAVV